MFVFEFSSYLLIVLLAVNETYSSPPTPHPERGQSETLVPS